MNALNPIYIYSWWLCNFSEECFMYPMQLNALYLVFTNELVKESRETGILVVYLKTTVETWKWADVVTKVELTYLLGYNSKAVHWAEYSTCLHLSKYKNYALLLHNWQINAVQIWPCNWQVILVRLFCLLLHDKRKAKRYNWLFEWQSLVDAFPFEASWIWLLSICQYSALQSFLSEMVCLYAA